MKFRKDINGLRALAVIAVVIFHFNPTWLPGGFAGVDVFFVISGFLMTGIIFRGIEKENFSLLKFYVARANRIIPALAVLCLTLLIFGYLYLTPLEHKLLGKHVTGSMAFLSNIIYLNEAGYFDASSLEKWLLHTWSLSVEWQFYIIYPLVLLALYKLTSQQTLKKIIIYASAISFLYCIYLTSTAPSSAYYLLSSRAWEMMVGGLAYVYPFSTTTRQKKMLELTGLTFILGSYFFVSASTPWPGLIALFPVVGAFFIIQAQRNDSIITGNIIFEKLGAWSYSIYLWHWPLVVAIYYFSLKSSLAYLAIPLSVLLGYLSFKYIESIRFNFDLNNIFSLVKLKVLYVAILVCASGSLIFSHYQNKQQALGNLEVYDMASRESGYCFGSPGAGVADDDYLNCKIGLTKKTSRVLLFGDSFAGHFEPLLDIIGKYENIAIDAITTNSCYPSFSKEFNGEPSHIGYSQCMANREYVENNIKNYDMIFISARWDAFLNYENTSPEEVINMINHITEQGTAMVYLPSPSIYKRNIGEDYISHLLGGPALDNKSFIAEEENTKYIDQVEQQLAQLAQRNNKFIYVHKDKLFTNDTLVANSREIPYSADGAHISIIAALELSEKMIKLDEYKAIKKYFKKKRSS
ncbi:acyltransferase family protein [Oceanisphaera avium]|uniref:Acyltransferase n=1 Tax=Oceanisphaera avium TaxID=1903694 RepID=A0A1Y0D189_9GAMM|nr:acyltransferase family protein [Oceanisphaera avium]ART80875.1 hypothetical protein CBP12_12500 [Oceanisphaera avium]